MSMDAVADLRFFVVGAEMLPFARGASVDVAVAALATGMLGAFELSGPRVVREFSSFGRTPPAVWRESVS